MNTPPCRNDFVVDDSEYKHICYALNDGYSDYVAVSIISLLENNSGYFHFHILTDYISERNVQKLSHLVSKYNALLTVHKIDDTKLEGQKMTWSKYTWFRIFTSEYIKENVDKVLYLDVDVIISGNIDELFKIDLTDKAVAAVPDIMTVYPHVIRKVGYDVNKGYFCAGVLLMNLDYFREHSLANKILDFALKNPERINFPDQDALNFICQDSKVNLPLKYDILRPFFTDSKFIVKFREEVLNALVDPKIIHYAGCNPWKYESEHHYFENKFWEYAKLLPFEVRKTHVCSGVPLLKLRTKKLLGYIGIPAFTKYKKKRKPTYKEIVKLLEQ